MTMVEWVWAVMSRCVLFVPAAYFVWAARRAKLRSNRLANLGLCVAIAGGSVSELVAFLVVGRLFDILATCAVGLGAVGLASAAFYYRRFDGGGAVRPIIAVVLGALMCNIALTSIPDVWKTWASSPWTYHAADGSYELTLPSRRWHQDVLASYPSLISFASSTPIIMNATVLSVEHDKTERDFAAATAKGLAHLERAPGSHADSYDGVNASGNHYRYFTMEIDPKLVDLNIEDPKVKQLVKRTMLADCYTWSPKTQVLVEVVIQSALMSLSQDSPKAAAAWMMICQGVE
jgi:hypothetical protein